MMEDLIAALQILLKYGNPKWPTCCEHDGLHIGDSDNADVTDADKAELERLGFEEDTTDGGFYSFRFGSA